MQSSIARGWQHLSVCRIHSRGAIMDRLFAILFVIGLTGMSYLYGVASAKFALFPYEFVHQGWLAANALREALSDDSNLPGVVAVETSASPPTPPKSDDVGAERDLILMTGWAGALMDHCPNVGCFAWIMNRQGKIHHAWAIDPEEPWGDTTQMSGFTRVENFYPSSLHLYDNGDLLVSYQGHNTYPYSVGLAMFDKAGKLLWKNELHSHHKLNVDGQGTIYTPAHKLIDSPLKLGVTDQELRCETRKIYDDVVYIIGRDGAVIDEISILRSLIDSGFSGLVALTPDTCDPIHLNYVDLLRAQDVSEYPGLSRGDLLVSMRHINALAIINRYTKQVKWLVSGLTIQQHNPRYIGNNKILVLDNLGGDAAKGGTRLVEIDLSSRRAVTVFPTADTPDLDFFTRISGYFDLDEQRSRALVALSLQGRVLEIDLRTHKVLWEYTNVHDVSKYLENKGEESKGNFSTFAISAVYYVSRPSFLSNLGLAQ
jgi:Arylsulfotransferase (ASST)